MQITQLAAPATAGNVATDATAGDRYAAIEVLDENGSTVYSGTAGAAQLASTAIDYPVQDGERETSVINGTMRLAVPASFHLREGWTLRVRVAGGATGDGYTVRLSVAVD